MFSAVTSPVPTVPSEFIDGSQVKSAHRLLSFVFDVGMFSLRRLELFKGSKRRVRRDSRCPFFGIESLAARYSAIGRDRFFLSVASHHVEKQLNRCLAGGAEQKCLVRPVNREVLRRVCDEK